MKAMKKTISIILSIMMILTMAPMCLTVFAKGVTSALYNDGYTQPQYTQDELKSISDTGGYDLTQEQIEEIAAGKASLSDVLEDKEEKVTVVVQLSSDSVLSDDNNAITDGKLSYSAEKEQKKIERQQNKIEDKISDKVFDGEDVDVIYSYSLLTNAFAIEARESQINEIAGISGVESVYTAPIYEAIPTDESTEEYSENYFTGSDNTTDYSGEGTVTAVIDTGIDIDHEAFANSPKNAKFTQSYIADKLESTHAYQNSIGLTAENAYRNEKVPFAFNYADTSTDVSHDNDTQGDHGTHVSGIIGGYAVDNEGKILFEGVAPETQLVVMKVFGDKRAGNYADILAAVEDAVLLGVDSINLSLGSWAGFTYAGDNPELDVAYENAANAGIVVCASAGNDYTSAYGTLYGNDLALASNPDNGIVSAPASYDDNLAIASVAGNAYLAKVVRIAGMNMAYTCNATDEARNIEKYANQSGLEYAVLMDSDGNMLKGSSSNFESYADACDVKGKFVVVKRGLTFTQTVSIAQSYGAIGLIVCDNVDGSLVNMAENDSATIPAIFISMNDGNYLLDQNGKDNSVNITNSTGYIENPAKGTMSEFSSWGVTSDLKLKPEITGYGGNIYSTKNDNTYGLMSGTSMAAPYVSGVSALVAEKFNSIYSGDSESLKTAKKTFAVSVMMSTATTVIEKTTGVAYSPRKQGAGLVNVDAALSTNAYISVDGSKTPKIDFGDDKDKTGKYDLTFSVVNSGTQELSFAIDASVQTEKVEIQDVSYKTKRLDPLKAEDYYDKHTALGDKFESINYDKVNAVDELKNVKFMSGLPYDLTSESIISTDKADNIVTVAAGDTASVTVSVTLGSKAKEYMNSNFENGIYVEGFITLTSKTENQPSLVVPYMGFYGDWTSAPIIDEGTLEQEYSGEAVHPQMSVSSGNSAFSGILGMQYTPLGTNYLFDTPFFFYYWGRKNNTVFEYKPSVRNLISNDCLEGLDYDDDAAAAVTSLLRNAREINYKVTDNITGEVYADVTKSYVRKTIYYSEEVGMVNAGYFDMDTYIWPGTDAHGNKLPSGTQATYTVTAYLDYGNNEDQRNNNNAYSFNVIIDGGSPTLENVEFYRDEDTGDTMAKTTIKDDFFPSQISYKLACYSDTGSEGSAYITAAALPQEKGETFTSVANISQAARESGLSTVRAVGITGEDFVRNDLVGGCYSYDTYYFPFHDKVNITYPSNIIPVGNAMVLDQTSQYGYAVLGTKPLNPENGNNADYSIEEGYVYTTSDSSIATVTPGGIVEAKSPGYVNITVEGEYSHISSSFRLRVIDYELQKMIDEAADGSTIKYTAGDITESISIDKDITLDLGGATLCGVDGSPAIKVSAGNVTIKNGNIDSTYSKDSENPLLVDILNDAVSTVDVVGGNLTLSNVTISGSSAELNGDSAIAGSAVKLSGEANIIVDSSKLVGLYAINNSSSNGGTVTIDSGDLEGMLGSVESAENVTSNEDTVLVDITNSTIVDDAVSYDGTVTGSDYDYYSTPDVIYVSGEQIAQGSVTSDSTLRYDAENGCAVYGLNKNFTFPSTGKGPAYKTQNITVPGVNINADEYKYMVIIESGVPNDYCNVVASSSSTVGFSPSKTSYADLYHPSIVKASTAQSLARSTTWNGNLSSFVLWPAYATATTAIRTGAADINIYGVIFTKTEAAAKSLVSTQGLATTTNMKAVNAQSFNSKLAVNGNQLNVNVVLDDVSDGTYKWIPSNMTLYKTVSTGEFASEKQFVETKDISIDENGEINTVFSDIDPTAVYTVDCDFELSLITDNTVDLYSVNENDVSALIDAMPELIEQAGNVEAFCDNIKDIANYLLYDIRDGYAARDARHYDSPYSASKGPAVYPDYDKYPDLIWTNTANSGDGTWLSFYDTSVLSTSVVGKGTTLGALYLVAKVLGDSEMGEIMANLQSTLPESVWNGLDANYREGKFGFEGTLPSYYEAIDNIAGAFETGSNEKEKLANGLKALNDNLSDVYISLYDIYSSGADSNVAGGSSIKAFHNLRGWMDYNDDLINNYRYKRADNVYILSKAVADFYESATAIQKTVDSFKDAIGGTALVPALKNYDDDSITFVNTFFAGKDVIDGSFDTGINKTFSSLADYDGYIEYQLNGGVNNEANPSGYQKAFPISFEAPTKEGYSFAGWYTTESFNEGTQITATSQSTNGDLVLFAKWDVNTYDVTYTVSGETYLKQSHKFGEALNAPENVPDCLGYVFDYWYETNENVPYDFSTMPSKNITLSAKLKYISLQDINFNDGIYEWQFEDNSPLRLVITEDCTIDFGGKTIKNLNDFATIKILNGANVTIKNAVFAPDEDTELSNENYSIYVSEKSTLNIENCVVRGDKKVTDDGYFYTGSAVKVDSGSLNVKNSALTGLYAVDNALLDNDNSKVSVSVENSAFVGVVSAVRDINTLKPVKSEEIDSSMLTDATFAKERVSIYSSAISQDSYTSDYSSDNSTLTVTAEAMTCPSIADGSLVSFKPECVSYADSDINFDSQGKATISDLEEGEHQYTVKYSADAQLSSGLSDDINNIDSMVITAVKTETSAFDALVAEYESTINYWDSYKAAIKAKFYSTSNNSVMKVYLETIRECLENVGGNDYTGTLGSGKGIFPTLKDEIAEYKNLSNQADKLSWLMANKDSVIAQTIELNRNFTIMSSECEMLNGLSQFYYGDDYTEKLGYVDNITDMTTSLKNGAKKLPSVAAAEYLNDNENAANDILNMSASFVTDSEINALWDGARTFDDSVSVKKITYKLYDEVIGETESESVFILSDSDIPEHIPNSREGRIFSGWVKDNVASTQTETIFNGSMTKGKYDVNYYVDGKLFKSFEDVTYMDSLESVSAPTKTGFDFIGWKAEGFSENPESMPASNLVFNAVFEKKTFTVTFKSDASEDIVKYVKYGETLSDVPDVPSKDHYTQTAPYWDISDFTDVTENITVNAVYTPDVYTVTWTVGDNSTTEQYTYNSLPEYKGTTPVKAADDEYFYTFAGFSPIVEAVQANTTYTAEFTANSKAIPEYVIPMNLEAVYGQKLSDVTLPDAFQWNDPDALVGNAGINVVKATYTPEDTEHELIVSDVNIAVNVKKADPNYTSIETLTAIYADKLEDIILPQGFSWSDSSTTVVGNVGESVFNVTFTPDDTDNYNVITNIPVTVKVEKADAKYTVPTALSAVYGQTLSDVALPDGFSWSDSSDTSVGNAGTAAFNVVYTPEDTDNFNVMTDIPVTIEVKKAVAKCGLGTLKASAFSNLYEIELPAGYSWISSDETLTKTGESVFKVMFTPEDTANYESVIIDVTVNVVDEVENKVSNNRFSDLLDFIIMLIKILISYFH